MTDYLLYLPSFPERKKKAQDIIKFLAGYGFNLKVVTSLSEYHSHGVCDYRAILADAHFNYDGGREEVRFEHFRNLDRHIPILYYVRHFGERRQMNCVEGTTISETIDFRESIRFPYDIKNWLKQFNMDIPNSVGTVLYYGSAETLRPTDNTPFTPAMPTGAGGFHNSRPSSASTPRNELVKAFSVTLERRRKAQKPKNIEDKTAEATDAAETAENKAPPRSPITEVMLLRARLQNLRRGSPRRKP